MNNNIIRSETSKWLDSFYDSIDDTSTFDFSNIAEDAVDKFRKDMGNINILVAGKTGVGKSTLINAIFHDNLAETGIGKPITQNIHEYTKEGSPVSIIDTKGLELKDYQLIIDYLKTFIKERKNRENINDKLHVAWICISESSSRIEEAEVELINMLTEFNIPVIVVITKALVDNGLKESIEQTCPNTKCVIRVQATSILLSGGYEIKPKNLELLVKETNDVIPEGIKNAFIASQKVNVDLKEKKALYIIELYRTDAIKSNNSTKLANCGINLITDISGVFGLKLEKSFINNIVSTMYGDNKSKFIKFLQSIINHIPGINKKSNLCMDDSIFIIKSIGMMYIKALKDAFNEGYNQTLTETDLKKSIQKIKKETLL